MSNIVPKMRACIGQAPKAIIDRDDSDMAIVNSLMSVMVSSEVRPGSQAERTGLISGWDSFYRMPYLQRRISCSAYIFYLCRQRQRLVETVTCICEVHLVRFAEHNAGRQKLNERSVPSFVPAASCERCGFPNCSGAR